LIRKNVGKLQCQELTNLVSLNAQPFEVQVCCGRLTVD
jgi:hypothetical protein